MRRVFLPTVGALLLIGCIVCRYATDVSWMMAPSASARAEDQHRSWTGMGPATALRYEAESQSASRTTAPPESRTAAEVGWDLIRTRDFQAALAQFSHATATSPRDPGMWLGLGVSHYRLAQFTAAETALMQALTLDSSLEQAHVLLGELAFLRDDLPGAIWHYKSAQVFNPNDVLIQDGLYAAQRAYQLEAGFLRVRTIHFVVKCDNATPAAMKSVADRLEGLYQRVGDRLKYYPEDIFVVVLYSDRRFRQFTDSPAWAGGLFDGKIHLAAQRVLQPSRMADGALAHEYSHAVVHRLAGDRLPTWLDEGLALYFEGRSLEWAREMLARRGVELTPLHALHGNFLNLGPAEASLAYAESLSATSALIERHGWSQLRSLLEMVLKSDFNAAFETAFKEPYHAFESFWITAERHRGL